jgi:hypothetical protein
MAPEPGQAANPEPHTLHVPKRCEYNCIQVGSKGSYTEHRRHVSLFHVLDIRISLFPSRHQLPCIKKTHNQ